MMNANPQAAAEQDRKSYRDLTTKLSLLGLDPAIPAGVRSLAEKSVARTREAYDRSMDAFEASGRRLRDPSMLPAKVQSLRHYEIVGGQLARANRCTDGPSGRSPRAFNEGDSRCRRANQGAGETQRGMRFVRPPELLAPRLKYATGQR
jgi:hypothetical protein